MDSEMLLSCALDIGEQMLISGAEIGRVEDSVRRICEAYDIKRVDVFTITSSIVATLQNSAGKSITQTRRIVNYRTDLTRLHNLNNLSRKICESKPDLHYIAKELENIKQQKAYPLVIQCLACALIAGSFTIFFGGTWFDAIPAAIIGAVLKAVVYATDKAKVNMIFANVVCSFIACFLAFLFTKIGFGASPDKIIIGNIMLLIPGIALTNSIRDMISGDIMAGMLRFLEACIIALAIAAGYVLTALMFGGAAL